MNKTYRISNDGTIFEIKEDGSIAKLAKIDDAGNISTISNTEKDKSSILEHHNSASKIEYDKAQAICGIIDMLRNRSHTTVTKDVLIDKLFPVAGVKIGKTHISELKEMNFYIRSEGSLLSELNKDFENTFTNSFWGGLCNRYSYYFFKGNISGYCNKDNIVSNVICIAYDAIPLKWYESFGFSLELSYNNWLTLLNKNGFEIFSIHEPEIIKEKVGFLNWRNRYFAVIKVKYPGSSYQLKFEFNRIIKDKQQINNDTPNVISTITVEPTKL